MAYIQVIFQGAVKEEIPINKSVITIGRSSDNDICIENQGVSGHHARIVQEGNGQFLIEDRQSTNGTYVNGDQITQQMLQHNDVIAIFKHTLKFINMGINKIEEAPLTSKEANGVIDDPDATVMVDTSQIEGLLHKHQVDAAIKQGKGNAKLVVMDSNGQRTLTLEGVKYTIGKQKGSHILAKGWFAPATSAVIHHTQNGYTLTPHKRGKVKINGKNIGEPVRLEDGDQIIVRNISMQFYIALN